MVSYVKPGVSARRSPRYFNDVEAAPPETVAALQERKALVANEIRVPRVIVPP